MSWTLGTTIFDIKYTALDYNDANKSLLLVGENKVNKALNITSASINDVTWNTNTLGGPNNNPWTAITCSNDADVWIISSLGTASCASRTAYDTFSGLVFSTPTNVWTSIAYSDPNQIYVAVAKTGTGDRVMSRSIGGTPSWTSQVSAADNDWTSVVYGNGIFVAVANSGIGNRVMTSPDGINWTSQVSAADNDWTSVAYGSGIFVAVANSGIGNRSMFSYDGINWTSQVSAADYDWRSVTYSNVTHQFVSVGSNNATTSILMFYSPPNSSSFSFSDGTTEMFAGKIINTLSYNHAKTLIGTTISDIVTTISDNTFIGQTSLSSFLFSNTISITSIGNNVFQNCSSLTSITIPDSVTTIGTDLFYGCTGLTNCTLSDLLTSIPTNTFYGCNNLIFIEIPPNITTIASFSFSGCSNLETIVFDNASSANNKLNYVDQNSGFATVNSSSQTPYPLVTYYNSASDTELTQAAQNIVWPNDTYITYNSGASCFAKETKILCLNKNFEEEYIPIEKLRKGDLVKSYLHGYRKIELIGKGYSVSDINKFTECMYKMVKTETNGLIEDLIITGGHGLLVNDLGEYTEKTKQIWNEPQKIDDKYLLLAGISNDFEKLETVPSFYYYQFILENNGDNKERFGIWANGVLVETSAIEHFLNQPYMLL